MAPSLHRAFELIELHPQLADFEGAPGDHLVRLAERALGVRLMGDYGRFVRRYGAGNFGGVEVYGVFTDRFSPPGPPEMVGSTLEARRVGLDPSLLIVGDGGDGTTVALDGHGRVVRLVVGAAATPIVEHESFGDFLPQEVAQEIAAS